MLFGGVQEARTGPVLPTDFAASGGGWTAVDVLDKSPPQGGKAAALLERSVKSVRTSVDGVNDRPPRVRTTVDDVDDSPPRLWKTVDGLDDSPPRLRKTVDALDESPPRKLTSVDAVDDRPPGAAKASDAAGGRQRAQEKEAGANAGLEGMGQAKPHPDVSEGSGVSGCGSSTSGSGSSSTGPSPFGRAGTVRRRRSAWKPWPASW